MARESRSQNRVPLGYGAQLWQMAEGAGARQEASLIESLTLSSLRDALLPKLISGDLRVKDADRFVGKVPA